MSGLKNLIKHVFPVLLLKKAFLLYNRAKSRTWDRLFFRKLHIPVSSFSILRTKNPFLELTIDQSQFSPIEREKLSVWADPEWVQDEYLFHYTEQGFIEPKTGWALTKSRKLIYPSLGFSSAPYVRKPSWTQTHFSKKKVTSLDRIISLRDTGEENYFHFYNDVMAKLDFLRENGINPSEFKIVISERLYSKEYFRVLINEPSVANLLWYIQSEGDWISFDEAIFCKPYTHTRRYFSSVVRSVGRFMPEPRLNQNIFLTRSPKTLRFIENESELLPLLQKHDFEVVDSANLSFIDQITMFANCRNLVGIHGAGLTNMIFRENYPMSILEIVHPQLLMPFHYVMLANMFQFKYGMLLGEKGVRSVPGGFRVNLSDFERKLEVLLSSRQSLSPSPNRGEAA